MIFSIRKTLVAALAALAALSLLGACANMQTDGGGSTSVGSVTTFDIATAEPAEVADALDRDGRVILRGINFDFDSAELNGDAYASVSRMGQILADRPNLMLAVVGHTDSTGAFQYNVDLSKRRADAIVAALREDFEIEPKRLVGVGVGPLAPIDTNSTEFGQDRNRRVELVVIN
jgi:outer membrane protein OmpA-like peptidoglycan-associated protein